MGVHFPPPAAGVIDTGQADRLISPCCLSGHTIARHPMSCANLRDFCATLEPATSSASARRWTGGEITEICQRTLKTDRPALLPSTQRLFHPALLGNLFTPPTTSPAPSATVDRELPEVGIRCLRSSGPRNCRARLKEVG